MFETIANHDLENAAGGVQPNFTHGPFPTDLANGGSAGGTNGPRIDPMPWRGPTPPAQAQPYTGGGGFVAL